MTPRPVLLVVLDGWGIRPEREGNAVALADTPVMDRLQRAWPAIQLRASGRAVGLPEGQMGNSEVGHLTIGAGRVLLQDVTRIDDSIASGEFYRNPLLVGAFERARREGAALHVLGLLSDGGVHSHMNHAFALLEMARRLDAPAVFVHAFTDGRDAAPTSGVGFVDELLRTIDRVGVGRLATIVGRYYAMDRDRRWERTRVAYEALTLRAGRRAADPVAALEESYASGVTDEFVTPVVFEEAGVIHPGDGVIFFNFRADRGRQLTRALADPAFDGFPRRAADGSTGRGAVVRSMVTMAAYDEELEVAVAYPRDPVRETLGEVVARAGLVQLRAAETEKYAHVTYFLNGGLEQPWPGEERLLVPSPKVATYDLAPEMSAPELTSRVIESVRRRPHDLTVLNYANPDMVGHTGNLEAAIRAVAAVDRELGRLLDAFPGPALVIADHGNAETMLQPDGRPHTAHTTNPVPCVLVGAETRTRLRTEGELSDVAPTLLNLLGVPVPAVMGGRDLREGAEAAATDGRGPAKKQASPAAAADAPGTRSGR